MNETELRNTLSHLGVGISLDAGSSRLDLSDEDRARMPDNVAGNLDRLEQQIVRTELHKASLEYVHRRLSRNGGPGLTPLTIAAFGNDGRYDILRKVWVTGTLDEFKAALKDCIEAAVSAGSPNMAPRHAPQSTSDQLDTEATTNPPTTQAGSGQLPLAQ